MNALKIAAEALGANADGLKGRETIGGIAARLIAARRLLYTARADLFRDEPQDEE